MAEKVKQTKTEEQNQWIYQHEKKRIEKLNVNYIFGQAFTY